MMRAERASCVNREKLSGLRNPTWKYLALSRAAVRPMALRRQTARERAEQRRVGEASSYLLALNEAV